MSVSVQCLTHGIHSGTYSGIAPDSMRIFRNLISRLETIDEQSGNTRIPDLEVTIDNNIIQKAKENSTTYEQNLFTKIQIESGVKLSNQDSTELILNSTWRPSLAIIG